MRNYIGVLGFAGVILTNSAIAQSRSVPTVSQEFSKAIISCIDSGSNNPEKKITCNVSGKIGENEENFINSQGYVILSKLGDKVTISPIIPRTTAAAGGIQLIPPSTNSRGYDFSSRKPDCSSLLSSGTTISGAGNIRIGTISTDQKGSSVHGVDCENR